MRNSNLKSITSLITLAGLTLFLSTFSFSRTSKKNISQKSGYKSAWSQTRSFPGIIMEASHLSHLYDGSYDDPEVGELLTPLEHLAFHWYFRDEPGLICLTPQDNEYAIRKISERVRYYYENWEGIILDDEQLESMVQNVIKEYMRFIDRSNLEEAEEVVLES